MENGTTLLEAFHDWLTLRNYARPTIKSYTSRLRQFLLWRQRHGYDGPIQLAEVRGYLVHRSAAGLSWSSINGDYSALQTCFVEVLGRDWDVDHLPRPRSERGLPTVISRAEVERLINAGTQPKHRAFMALLYGTGLRLSEALGLKITDVDGQRRQLRVRRGKGRKDRYVQLPAELLTLLRDYYRACQPQDYLFNGLHPGSRWANRAAQYAIEKAALAAGIVRPVSAHILRHCYATHHLERGTNILFVKEQLGHRNLTTTAKYIHLCVNYERTVSHPLEGLEVRLGPFPETLAE